MELTGSTGAVDTGFVASGDELAAVAELMKPSERLVGDPPLYSRPSSDILLVLISPTEPTDDSDDE